MSQARTRTKTLTCVSQKLFITTDLYDYTQAELTSFGMLACGPCCAVQFTMETRLERVANHYANTFFTQTNYPTAAL